MERLNRSYKRTLRLRRILHSAEAVIFLLGSLAKEMTEITYAGRLPYFQDWSIKSMNNNSNNTKPFSLCGIPQGESKSKSKLHTFSAITITRKRLYHREGTFVSSWKHIFTLTVVFQKRRALVIFYSSLIALLQKKEPYQCNCKCYPSDNIRCR